MKNQAYFKDIRRSILSLLQSADEEINIAMAWFTNVDLLDAIIACAQRGVRVRLILLDDVINHCDFGADFNRFIAQDGCSLYLYPQSKKFMHNKFCVIDGKTVVTGSYNWTNYAETKNLENIVISDDESLISEYRECFEELLSDLPLAEDFEILSVDQIPPRDFAYRVVDLAHEVFAASSTVAECRSRFESVLSKNQIDLPQVYSAQKEEVTSQDVAKTVHDAPKVTLTKVEDFQYEVSRYNIGFKAKLKAQNGKEGLKVLVPKGVVLPYSAEVNAETANTADMTANTTCELYYGETEDLSQCTKIMESLHLSGLPAKKVGEVKFKIVVTLEKSGVLKVSFVCLNTSKGDQAMVTNSTFVEIKKS